MRATPTVLTMTTPRLTRSQHRRYPASGYSLPGVECRIQEDCVVAGPRIAGKRVEVCVPSTEVPQARGESPGTHLDRIRPHGPPPHGPRGREHRTKQR